MEFLIVLLLLVLIFVVIFRREIDFLIDLAVTLGVIAFAAWGLWTLLGPSLPSLIGWVLTGIGVYWWMKDRKKKRQREQAVQPKGE